MFILLTIKDVIRIEPSKFAEEHIPVGFGTNLSNVAQTLIKEINRKYSNKVILDYGLCISFFDFIRIEPGKIYPGDGASHNEGNQIDFYFKLVEFRMILFRPVEGEVIVGKVLSSNKNGIRVSLEFTEDVWIPSYNCSNFSSHFIYSTRRKCI